MRRAGPGSPPRSRGIDFDRLDGLIRQLVEAEEPPVAEPARVGPVAVDRLPRTDAERVARRHAAERGAAMLAAGEVAVVVVAGGQGTRLGFDGPKGTYPIGPVSGASLFQIHAEKIAALGRRHGRAIPLYIMTSPENHEATGRFFAAHGRSAWSTSASSSRGRCRRWTARAAASCWPRRAASR
jgi:UDP-N-acetylglucosamine/UDP-N-acetylgalactosamine diphosphorylase